jgi:virulence-associated protein VapD
MARKQRVLLTVLQGNADANIAFSDLRGLLRGLGFDERIRGSHYIFSKNGIEEIINIQARGSKAKPYQVK